MGRSSGEGTLDAVEPWEKRIAKAWAVEDNGFLLMMFVCEADEDVRGWLLFVGDVVTGWCAPATLAVSYNGSSEEMDAKGWWCDRRCGRC